MHYGSREPSTTKDFRPFKEKQRGQRGLQGYQLPNGLVIKLVLSAIHTTVFLWPTMCATITWIIFMDEECFTVQVFWTESDYSEQTSSFTNSGHVLAGSSWMVQQKDSSFINTHWRGYKSTANGSLGTAYLSYVLFPYSRRMTGYRAKVPLLLQLHSQQRKNSNYAAYSPSSSLLFPSKKSLKTKNMFQDTFSGKLLTLESAELPHSLTR